MTKTMLLRGLQWHGRRLRPRRSTPRPRPAASHPTAASPLPPQLCTNSCEHANDNVCDDGGAQAAFDVCALGSDCNDCGSRPVGGDNSCEWANDGMCDEAGHELCVGHGDACGACDAGTDAYDCNGGGDGQEGEGEGPAGGNGGVVGGESDCAPGCPSSETVVHPWPGDGICDDTCNNEACNFDNGDCGESEAQEPEGGQEGEGGDESQEPTDDPQSSPGPGEQGPSSGCSNTCAHANDHECDDGGANSMYDLCALGTDANDCGGCRDEEGGESQEPVGGDHEQPVGSGSGSGSGAGESQEPDDESPGADPVQPVGPPVGSGSGSGSGSGVVDILEETETPTLGCIYQSASNYNPAARKDDGSCAFMCVVDEPDTIGMTDLYAADATRRKRKLGLVKQIAEKRAYVAARALHAKKMVAVKRQLVAKKGATLHAPPEKQLAMKRSLQAKSAASKRQLLSPAAMKKKIAAAVSRTPAGKKEMAAKRELQAQKLSNVHCKTTACKKKLAAKMSKPAARHH